MAGAPEVKWVHYSGTVTFDNVADFGPGVLQPAIGVWGLYRIRGVSAVRRRPAGCRPCLEETSPLLSLSGFRVFGAGKVSWKADGSALAYGMRSDSNIWQIPANPPYGSTGAVLPVVENAAPSLVAWGPTAATQDQYLYYSNANGLNEGYAGIYLNTLGDTSGGDEARALRRLSTPSGCTTSNGCPTGPVSSSACSMSSWDITTTSSGTTSRRATSPS